MQPLQTRGPHPLTLPEILLHLSKFLDTRTRAVSMRVCQHAAEFIQQHQSTLKDISYDTFSTYIDLTDDFLDALDSCSQLESLSLPTSICKARKWSRHRVVRSLWSRLVSLTLYGVHFFYEGPTDTTQLLKEWADQEGGPVQVNLKTLRIYAPYASMYHTVPFLILVSTELTDLLWMGGGDMTWLVAFLADAIRTGTWTPTNLKSLGLNDLHLDLRDFKTNLGATPHLQNLDVHRSKFDVDHWHILRFEYPHYLTQLTTLKVRECKAISGQIVQQMLCEMPNLEVFEGPHVKARHLLEDNRPWICSRLRFLTLFFFLDDATGAENGSAIVLAQLAKMTRLQRLTLRLSPTSGLPELLNYQTVAKRENGLELSLDKGLASLSELKRLRSFSGTGDARVAPWTNAEAEWVLKSWVSLESIAAVHLSQKSSDLLSQHVDMFDCPIAVE